MTSAEAVGTQLTLALDQFRDTVDTQDGVTIIVVERVE
jgi:hypothetical protein